MKQKLFIGITLAIGLMASGAWADEFLSNAGGFTDGSTSITNGDKTFSNFTCSIVIDQVAAPSDCNRIKVLTGTDLSGNLGLVFQAAFKALYTTTLGDGAVDILLGYKVTAPAAYITDIHMVFNGQASGTGSTDVTEQVSAGTSVVGQIDVTNPPPTLEAAAILSGGPYTSVFVSKDILLDSGPGPDGQASISSIGQYFSQTSVPEPASIMLFGTCLLGCGALLRRRRNS